MIDRDRIAYLQELAITHFNDGNVSAAVSAWGQVLEIDPQNVEALRGLALANQGGAHAEPAAGEQDADATVMFTVQQMSQLARPPAPSGGFDAEKTMVFGSAAAAATPAFTLPPPAAPAPAPAGNFDADSTMLFGLPAMPAAPAPPSGMGGFDADRTMVFGSQPAATPAPPSAAPPAGGFDAEKTMMFGAPPAAPSFAPPPAAPSFAPPPAAPSFGAPPAAPSFAPPPAAPSFGAPPAAPSFGAPPAPGGGGFSFELPPPPAAKPGGGFGLPELPSFGPPPAFTPAAVPPPPTPTATKKAGAQFGDVDAGDLDSLAVPVIGVGAAAASGAPDDTKAREEEMKRRYEQEFGRSSPSSTPIPSAPVRDTPRSKLPLYLLLTFAVVMAGAWGFIKYWPSNNGPDGPSGPVRPVEAKLTKEQADQKIIEILAREGKALQSGDLTEAAHLLEEAQEVAQKSGTSLPPEWNKSLGEVEFEKQYRARFEKALRRFCVEDYSSANLLFSELEQAKASDPEPGRYIERIYYNLGISELQKKQPWEAGFYFENLLARNPADAEVQGLLQFAKQWAVGSDLGYQYTKRVDPLTDRTAGCR